MALQFSRTLSSGITLPTAYARISSIMLSHSEVVVQVEVFADAQARLDLKPIAESISFSIPWTDSISLTNTYIALKEQDYFIGAEDC